VDHIWTSDPEPNGEHPVVALLAVLAILLAVLLIAWAGIEVHGTAGLQALAEPETPTPPRSQEERRVEEAVTSSRFATGLSP
jgi:hypothetical protein